MKRNIAMTVNGTTLEATVESRTLLIDCLRDQLGITGPKTGCVTGKCGACTVMLDGVSVKSCMIFAVQADGSNVLTVEGLADGENLHPMQKAFKENNAVQCGFCTPGMIISGLELAQRNPNPTEEDVKDAIEGNICRCTGYRSIISAIKQGCEKMSEKR